MTYTRTIMIVRHGQYDTSSKMPDGGSLTELGIEQARYTGRALANVPIDSIYASTMTRAIETANYIATTTGFSYQTTDLLREALPTIPPRYAEQILAMMETDPSLTHESINADKKRVDEAFEHFFLPPDGKDTIDVLVCHGNVLRYLVCKALGVNVDTWGKMIINHCGISTVVIDEQGLMRLATHNAIGHLPLAMITEA